MTPLGRVGRWLAAAGTASLLAIAASPAGADPAVLELSVRQGTGAERPLGARLGDAKAVVTFWATYCAPCRAEVPVLSRAAARWRGRGVRIVGVAVDVEDADALDAAVQAWGIDYDTYWVGPDAQEAAKALLPAGLPTSFFVGPGGVTRHDHLLTDEELDRLIAQHLGGQKRPDAPKGALGAEPARLETQPGGRY